MRELTQKELITLQEKSYHPYSKVKVATNGREYILVKNDKGKKLGARFLSTFVDVPLIGGKTNKEIKDDSSIKESNTTQLGGDENYVNKLAEITNLHNIPSFDLSLFLCLKFPFLLLDFHFLLLSKLYLVLHSNTSPILLYLRYHQK